MTAGTTVCCAQCMVPTAAEARGAAQSAYGNAPTRSAGSRAALPAWDVFLTDFMIEKMQSLDTVFTALIASCSEPCPLLDLWRHNRWQDHIDPVTPASPHRAASCVEVEQIKRDKDGKLCKKSHLNTLCFWLATTGRTGIVACVRVCVYEPLQLCSFTQVTLICTFSYHM